MRLSWPGIGLSFVLLAGSAAAFAQADSPGVALFNQCAEIRNDSERLSCFDRVTREMRAATRPSGTAATSAPGPASAQARNRQEREDFGLEAEKARERRGDRTRPIDRVTARVAAARGFGAGYWAILLEDGAIWEVVELDTNFRAPSRGDSVTIRRATFGGYLLYTNGQPSIRVRRAS